VSFGALGNKLRNLKAEDHVSELQILAMLEQAG